mgnify:CR=1 FL=1
MNTTMSSTGFVNKNEPDDDKMWLSLDCPEGHTFWFLPRGQESDSDSDGGTMTKVGDNRYEWRPE